MSLDRVIDAVTAAPARAIKLSDRAGTLAPGRFADITVCRVESGTFELADTYGKTRIAGERIVPTMAFKHGVRYDTDLARCQDERNWMLQIAEDHVPAAAGDLAPRQIAFLRSLRAALEAVDWTYDLARLDLAKAHALRALFDGVRAKHELPLREALLATFACFLDNAFTMQIGLFLLHLEQPFVLARLSEVTARELVTA